ncbi:MAG: DUF72 domain-containing protein [Acidimicrobiia bacterium]|nr:DUF72 domain-containing protein [Acidimicrobiia bacterium]
MADTDAVHALADKGVFLGTCSWTDKTLIEAGSFYPEKNMSAEERLGFYADRFPIVEVDATYYAPPAERVAGLWVERTPDDFVFDVKAFRLLTHHPTPPSALWRDFREALPAELAAKNNVYLRDLPRDVQADAFSRFGEALLPLHSAGKLGSVLMQLPPYAYPSRANFGYLKWAAAQLPDYRLAVEFRNGRWLDDEHREETIEFLDRHDLTFVAVDEPQGFKSSVPPLAAVTADVAEVRFHGRNADNWEKKGISAAERFRYDYQRPELEEWVDSVREMLQSASRVNLLMNNCYADYGIRSARTMAEVLVDAGLA